MPSKTTGKTKAATAPYTGWMFARDFSKGIFALLNSGKIYPAFGLLLVGLIGIAEWRLPPSQLPNVIHDLLATVRSSFGVVFALLLISNFCWAWLHARQRRLYDQEVARLAEIRRELIHNKDIVQIENHRSSEDVTHKTHIFPASTKGPSKGK